jgi:hypothetical protein
MTNNPISVKLQRSQKHLSRFGFSYPILCQIMHREIFNLCSRSHTSASLCSNFALIESFFSLTSTIVFVFLFLILRYDLLTYEMQGPYRLSCESDPIIRDGAYILYRKTVTSKKKIKFKRFECVLVNRTATFIN